MSIAGYQNNELIQTVPLSSQVLLYCQSSSKYWSVCMTNILLVCWSGTSPSISTSTATHRHRRLTFPSHTLDTTWSLISSSPSPAAASYRHVYVQTTSANMLSHTTLPVRVCMWARGSASTKPSCLSPRLSRSTCLSLSLHLPRWQFDLRRWSLQMEDAGPRWREKHRNRAEISESPKPFFLLLHLS